MSNDPEVPAGARAVTPDELYRTGSTEPWTANLIAALVAAQKPHLLLETGTYLGLTTRRIYEAMLTYAPEHGSSLTTVEFDKARAKAAYEWVQTWGIPEGVIGVAVEIVHAAAEAYIRAGLKDDSIDFAFLDDDHTTGHVYEELEALMPKMRKGGIIVMHDVVGQFGLGEVCKRFGGIVLELPRMHTAGGLGVITC